MTEAEWLASDDPAAMLQWLRDTQVARGFQANRHDGSKYDGGPSDRKLRLWVEACRQAFSSREKIPTTQWGDLEKFPQEIPACLASWSTGEYRTLLLPIAERAHLLRDIVGSPFRPVTLTRTVECDRCNGKGARTIGNRCGTCEGSGKTKGNADWLTPTVVSLARASYDHRDEQTGRLDPFRLALVADALEEAGCDGFQEACAVCGGNGVHPAFEFNPPLPLPVTVKERCKACNGNGSASHLRSPGPHVRGCWPVDLILGKE